MTTSGILACATAQFLQLLSCARVFGALSALTLLLACGSTGPRGGEDVAKTRAAVKTACESKIIVTPSEATVTELDTLQFTATADSGALSWSVREPDGGAVTTSGLYTSPPTAGLFHVDVRDVHRPTWFATATITVVPPPRILVFSADTTSIDYGAVVNLTIEYADGTGTLIPAWTPVASNEVATFSPTAPIDYSLSVTNAAGKSVNQSIHVDVHPVVVTLIPNAASVTTGDALDLLADVQNSVNPNVTFSVVEPEGGSVDANGTYLAPGVPGVYHVIATSAADPTKSATATLNVFPEPRIDAFNASPTSVDIGGATTLEATFEGGDGTMSPTPGPVISGVPAVVHPDTSTIYKLVVENGAGRVATADTAVAVNPVDVEIGSGPTTVTVGRTAAFTVAVTGAVDESVTWSIAEANATIDPAGNFTAQLPGTFHVVATSVADPQVTASATVLAIAAPAIQSFVADSAAVDIGSTVELTATFTGGVGAITPDVGPVSSAVSIDVVPQQRTTYLLAVTNDAGDVATATVDVGVREFQSVAPLATARHKHTATVLHDGRVLVAGGLGVGSALLGSIEVFDPAAGSWTTSMATMHPRAQHVATLLSDGRVVFTGGNGGSALTQDEAAIEVFDPATETTTIVGQLVTPRHDHAVTVLRSGRLLITGGLAGDAPLDAAELWDPTTGTSSALPPMTTPRVYHSAIMIPDGRVLLTGGAGPGSAGTYQALASAELFEPQTGEFRAVSGLSQARWGHSETINNGTLYVIGGKSTATDAGYLDTVETLPVSQLRYVAPPVRITSPAPSQHVDDVDPGPPTWDSNPPPVQFVASGVGIDDGPAIQRLLDQGARHIEFVGPDIEIDTPVRLAMGGSPYHGTILEPEPTNGPVTVHTNIGTNPNEYTDVTYAVFRYEGGYLPASRTATPSVVGDAEIRVEDGSWYHAGDYIAIFDGATIGTLADDGSAESRRVVDIGGHVLRLDRPLRRPHGDHVAVNLSAPIFGVRIHDLIFTGDAHVAIHLQDAQDCDVEGITSRAWTGGFLVLFDIPGQRNIVRDTYCTGTIPGTSDGTNAWGISLEGQEDTRVYDSGAELCGAGVVVNYGTDTWVYDVHAERNTVNLMVNGDVHNHGSLRSGFVGGEADAGKLRGVVVGPGSVDALVDVDFRRNSGYAIEVSAGAARTQLEGAVANTTGASSIGALLRAASYQTALGSWIHDSDNIGLSVESTASWLRTPALLMTKNGTSLVEGAASPAPTRLRQARARHVALEQPDGTIVIAGGVGRNIVSLLEAFDPVTGAFKFLPPSVHLHPGGTAIELGDGRLMLCGGFEKDAIADCEVSSFY